VTDPIQMVGIAVSRGYHFLADELLEMGADK